MSRPAFLLIAAILLNQGCGGPVRPTGSKPSTTESNTTPAKSTENNDDSIQSIDISQEEAGLDQPRSRKFRFVYGFAINQLPKNASVRVWLPVPVTNRHQKVTELQRHLPVVATISKEAKYDNKILYFETKGPESGQLNGSVTYDVGRTEIKGLYETEAITDLPQQLKALFLSPNIQVPIEGKPLELIADVKLPDAPISIGKVLYQRVDDHLKYDKSKPGYGNGDSVWACDSRFGNCTDFHSLFISLARSQGLPARFEIGFPIPEQRGNGFVGGYHCWAFFHVDKKGWVPVDISEADKHPEMKEYYFGNLTENRIAFTTGRDLELVPKQAGGPLNFFVYPYVEVDGKPWPLEKMDKKFEYEDL